MSMKNEYNQQLKWQKKASELEQALSIQDFLQKDQLQSILNSSSLNRQIHIEQWEFYPNYISFLKECQLLASSSSQILQNPEQLRSIKTDLNKILENNKFLITENHQIANNLIYPNKLDYFQVKILYQTKFMDIVQILCRIGIYSKSFLVLNIFHKSFRHSNELLGIGSTGNIYQCHQPYPHYQSVVKCLSFDPSRPKELQNHFKQFFFTDLMSALKIGPKIIKRSGFDCILFQNCLQFQIQQCLPFHKQTLQNDTKHNLFKMHSLQIVHCDIKPQNIMFSQFFHKNVFIDFGISQYIKEKWGQKSVITFRGTYEYCGEEMKKLSFQKKKNLVDLYKNDVQMLLKTFEKTTIKMDDENEFCKNKLIRNQNNETSIEQILVEFKSQLYVFQKGEKHRSTFKDFVNNIVSKINFTQSRQTRFVTELINFALRMEPQSIKNLFSEFIWQNKRFANLELVRDLRLQNIRSRSKLDAIQQGQIDPSYFYFKNIYRSLQSLALQSQQSTLKSSLSIQNLQFILFQKVQLVKIPSDQQYKLFLQYSKFWMSTQPISIIKKEQAASLLTEIIKSNIKESQILYLSQEYLPQIDFVNKSCKQIVFVYGFLLHYCMNGQFTEFKQKYMTLVLKDCIILGFQYFKFIKAYITHYFKKLIVKKSQKIISSLIVESLELKFLTRSHFLLSNEKKPFYDNKLYEWCSRKVNQALVSYIKQIYAKQDSYYEKAEIIDVLWSTIMYKWEHENLSKDDQINAKNNLIKILKSMEYELSSNKLQQASPIIHNALELIQFAFTEYQLPEDFVTAFKSGISRLQILPIKEEKNRFKIKSLDKLWASSNNHKAFKSLRHFDRMINCKELSQYFFVDLRYYIALRFVDNEAQFHYLQIVSNLKSCPCANYLIIIKSIPKARKMLNYQKKSKFNGFLEKILYLNLLIISVFSLNSQMQKQLYQTIVAFKKFVSINSQFLSSELISETLSLFDLVKLPELEDFILIKKLILLELTYNQTISHLKIKNEILSMYLMNLKKYKCVKQEQDENHTQIQNISFYRNMLNQMMTNSYSKINQAVCYWQNLRIRFILGKDQSILPLLKICLQFSEINKPKYQAEVFILVSYQTNIFISPQIYRQYFYVFYIIRKKLDMQEKFFYELLRLYERMKIKQQYDVHLLPVNFCLLDFKEILQKQPDLWKKLLTQVYFLLTKFLSIAQPQKNIVSLYKFKLDVFSVIYLDRLKIKKRKLNNLLRIVIKNKKKQYIIDEQQTITQNNLSSLNLLHQIHKTTSKYRKTTVYECFIKKFKTYKRLSAEQVNNLQEKQLKNSIQVSSSGSDLKQYVPFNKFKELYLKKELQKDMGIINKAFLEQSLRECYQINFRGFQLQQQQTKKYIHQIIKQGQSLQSNTVFQQYVSMIDEILLQEKRSLLQQLHSKGLSENNLQDVF